MLKTMITSSIVLPKTEPQSQAEQPLEIDTKKNNESRIVTAYRSERSRQEYAEVELSRAKIVTIDEHGNIKRVSLISEH